MIQLRSNNQGSIVDLHADAVLFAGPGYGAPVYAMSVIGPEQSIRALVAGCAMEKQSHRSELAFHKPDPTDPSAYGSRRKSMWVGGWNGRGHMVAPNCLHLVSFSKPEIGDDGESNFELIIPEGVTPWHLESAVYRTLVAKHSTPLIPLDSPGQPPWEAEAARQWCQVVAAEVMGDSRYWLRLDSMFADTKLESIRNARWALAGLLTITTEGLDTIVARLVRQRRIQIPNHRTEALAS